MSERFPTEKFSEGEKSPEGKLADFRAEISELKKQEDSKIEKSSHFQAGEFNPTELTKEDMDIYLKFKEGTLTTEELNRYRNKVLGSEGLAGDKGDSLIRFRTRGLFVGYIANKLSGILMREELKKVKQEK